MHCKERFGCESFDIIIDSTTCIDSRLKISSYCILHTVPRLIEYAGYICGPSI